MAKAFDQAAVVPLRNGLVGLVTSSNGKRWVVPKGGIDAGHTAQEAATIEAWEEAGWLGTLSDEPVGRYSYAKDGRVRQVVVYEMTVTDEFTDYPEVDRRYRVWVSAEEAITRLEEPELQAIVRAITSR